MSNKVKIFATIVASILMMMIMMGTAYAEEPTKCIVIAKEAEIKGDPDADAQTLFMLKQGEYVDIISEEDEWFLVQLKDGQTGWIYGDFIVVMDEKKEMNKTGVIIANKLNVRENPDAGAIVIGTLYEGAQVSLIDEQGDWYKVPLNDQLTGWIHGDFVKIITNHSTGKITGSNVNLRKTPSKSGEILASLSIDTFVAIKGYEGGWYSVITPEEKEGWVHEDFVTIELEVNSEKDAISRSAKRSNSLNKMVGYANSLLGRPYKYGTNGPSSFDCSGFTTHVFKNVGVVLPRSSKDQAKTGEKVSKSNLAIGDLVFFDTVGKIDGVVTHVGIYIGDGKFIHASSGKKAKKVTISEINEGYYKDRFVTARRMF